MKAEIATLTSGFLARAARLIFDLTGTDVTVPCSFGKGMLEIMIDCGADWLDRLMAIAPTAIVLTHAHPDHAWGLAKGAPCPVYATRETLDLLQRYPIRDRRIVPLGRTVAIKGVSFTAQPVQHSIRAPAVGYRVSAKAGSLFYLPDVAWLPNASNVLRKIDIYIGDGATMTRSMVRKKAWDVDRPLVLLGIVKLLDGVIDLIEMVEKLDRQDTAP